MNKDAKILFGDNTSKGTGSGIGAGASVLGKRTRRLSDQNDKNIRQYAMTSGNNAKQQHQVSSIAANVTHVIEKSAPVIQESTKE